MCGIAGIFLFHSQSNPNEALKHMVSAISHRGPDGEGFFFGNQAAIGHRRLSIIDLSAAASQPMKDESGRFVVAFNGEIYNFRELKKTLHTSFFSNSDTEVILRLFTNHREKTWGMLNGMFAIAILDNQTNELFLARDHAGIKPLYYYQDKDKFLFASELRSILASNLVTTSLNPAAISLYLQLGYFPVPFTPYNEVFKLEPGSALHISADRILANRFWEPQSGINDSSSDPEKELEALLLRSVEQQMISDVPVGAFLSGGIDSSLIVALMQRITGARVQTFTAGFSKMGYYDERSHAQRAAKLFDTEHHEFIVKDSIQELVPQLPKIFGEPFADSSAVPTYCLAKMTSQKVKVALSGTGGDEIFGGYRKYMAAHWAAAYTALPENVRSTIRKTVRLVPGSRQSLWQERALLLQRFSDLSPKIPPNLQLNAIFSFDEAHELIGDQAISAQSIFEPANATIAENMMLFDFKFYLPEDLLVKEDRCTMAFGLEARVPYLDRELIEFMQRLPITQKVSRTATKKIFRKVAAKYLPSWILRRPKHGFGSPAAEWLRKELREIAQPVVLNSKFFPESSILRKKWEEHQSGARDHSKALWAILMLELWGEPIT
jgi:asparagine synthase (glutamine-hydrolysing)